MRRTAEDAAETRRTIIRTALREFATHGWAGGSLVVIARRAGLTRGAVYHHFESKEALLRAVLNEEWVTQMQPVLDTLGASGVSPLGRLVSFLEMYITLLGTDEAFRDLTVVSTVVAPQAVELTSGIEEKRSALTGWEEHLSQTLTECGPLREGMSASQAVFVIMTFVHGLTLTAATEAALLPRGAAISSTSRAILYGLVPTP
ncbi:TetR/AcrR family transcriptional regulator [Cellulomonas sp. KRMCY2]|uniref:TetR/AcrR family transcriptional regulator n=1 Tax=Cellulomonas sp. KRMCY2 TaxID=1304865 RepID=UPI00045E84B5|nr:TetR/AcrR family transcriptional regulator [Cellulomonas sp. KRMCY2]